VTGEFRFPRFAMIANSPKKAWRENLDRLSRFTGGTDDESAELVASIREKVPQAAFAATLEATLGRFLHLGMQYCAST
jgi:hypothetical protein